MPIGAKRLHFTRIAIVVGSPVLPPPLSEGRTPRRAVEELSASLRCALQALFDQAEALAAH